MSEETGKKILSYLEATHPVKMIRGSQIATAILAFVGLVLFIYGLERVSEDIPIISNPYGSMIIGLILLLSTGLLWKKLIGDELGIKKENK